MGRGIDPKRAEELMRRRLHGARLTHTLGVRRLAARLARLHSVAPEPVEFAALLHDWAKEASEEEFQQRVESGALHIDPETLAMPQLHHAFLGASWIETELDVHDAEILDAVRFHPTGAAELGPLGRILFVADYAEPGRSHPDTERIRTLAESDLEGAVREVLRAKLLYLIGHNRRVHSKAWRFWNALLDPGAQASSGKGEE